MSEHGFAVAVWIFKEEDSCNQNYKEDADYITIQVLEKHCQASKGWDFFEDSYRTM